ncbi:MAG: ABC transporter substrate-binding protein [Kiloniellaceae bacterium]
MQPHEARQAKRIRIFASLVAAALLVGFALPAQAKTFRWAFQGDPVSMDPYTINETLTLGFLGNIYEGLVRRGKELEIQPGLATEWSTPAPDVWRFKLRAGVKFHDGTPFTADDVIFSWQRARHEDSDVKAFVAGIKEIKKIDDLTIDVVTKGPRPILTSEISLWYIMSKSWSEKHGTTTPASMKTEQEGYATRHANGTGPFILKSREPDVKTVLVPNPNWWDERTDNVTEAVFTPIKSAATRVASFLSGELEMMYPVPIQDIDRVKRAAGLRTLQGPEARTIFLGLDVWRDELLYSSVKGKNPLKDVRVRKAFYQAIDIEAIKKKVMRGASWPTGLMIGRVINGFDEELNQRFPYDPATAKSLLSEAGYPDGFEIVLDCPNDRYVNDESICQAVAAMLARVNVKVKLNAQTKAKHFAKIQALDTSFFLLGWTPATFDFHNVFYNNVMTRYDKLEGKEPQPGQGQWNCGGYSNPKVDALIDQVASEIDPNRRQDLIKQAMKIHKDEVGHIPLHQQPLSWGVKESVELHQSADNTFSLRWVRIN